MKAMVGLRAVELTEVFLASHVLNRIRFCCDSVVMLVIVVLRRWLMRLESTSIRSLPLGFRCAKNGKNIRFTATW